MKDRVGGGRRITDPGDGINRWKIPFLCVLSIVKVNNILLCVTKTFEKTPFHRMEVGQSWTDNLGGTAIVHKGNLPFFF